MASDAFALFRRTNNHELADLAEQHLKHDLTENDRNVLKSASSRLSTATMIGSLAGLALGGYLSYKTRTNRQKMFQAFRATEKPTHVKFANGREEAIPDITPYLRPTTAGNIAFGTFFGLGGLLIGGEAGLLSGTYLARSSIKKDPEARQRIEKAFNGFKIDILKTQISSLEGKNATKGGIMNALDLS